MAGELLLLGVIGLAVGSFLTLIVDRLDTAESMWVGRSHCNHCKKALRWWELLPFIGYFIVKGQCVRCNKTIPKIYPWFELITALAFIAVRVATPFPVNYWFLALELMFVSLLLILFFYDYLNQSFPVSVLIAAFVGAVAVTLTRIWLAALQYDPTWTTYWGAIQSYVIGGLVSGGFLALLAVPSRGKWMGYGDIFLSGILGLWLGYHLSIIALLAAFYTGAIVGVILLRQKKLGKDHHLAFGPYLILGAFIALVWGNELYLGLLKLWGFA